MSQFFSSNRNSTLIFVELTRVGFAWGSCLQWPAVFKLEGQVFKLEGVIYYVDPKSSSETQGQSGGSGERARWEFSSTGERAPAYRLFPKLQADAGSSLGTKNALYYCAQSANSFSWVSFHCAFSTFQNGCLSWVFWVTYGGQPAVNKVLPCQSVNLTGCMWFTMKTDKWIDNSARRNILANNEMRWPLWRSEATTSQYGWLQCCGSGYRVLTVYNRGLPAGTLAPDLSFRFTPDAFVRDWIWLQDNGGLISEFSFS